jgi:hypothetical protein
MHTLEGAERSANDLADARLEALGHSLFARTASKGVHARTSLFETVVDALSALIARHREPDTEVLRFPPVMSRHYVERSGYLHGFPHLLGCVCGLQGDDAEIHAAIGRFNTGNDWTDALSATDLVLKFDVASYCFRREATHEVDRLQAFRMHEFVCMGSPEQALDFRERWIARAKVIAAELALPHCIASASDPFFGRAARLIAQNQLDQSLKFEMLIPVRAVDRPTACMSFNCHRDHFSSTWGLRTENGDVAHTACVAFGMDRLALALFAIHGLDFARWPKQLHDGLAL